MELYYGQEVKEYNAYYHNFIEIFISFQNGSSEKLPNHIIV